MTYSKLLITLVICAALTGCGEDEGGGAQACNALCVGLHHVIVVRECEQGDGAQIRQDPRGIRCDDCQESIPHRAPCGTTLREGEIRNLHRLFGDITIGEELPVQAAARLVGIEGEPRVVEEPRKRFSLLDLLVGRSPGTILPLVDPKSPFIGYIFHL